MNFIQGDFFMANFENIKVENRETARAVLLARYGSIKAASRVISDKFKIYVDYERFRAVLKGYDKHKESINLICKELNIKPDVLEK